MIFKDETMSDILVTILELVLESSTGFPFRLLLALVPCWLYFGVVPVYRLWLTCIGQDSSPTFRKTQSS
jgi:hypothetical protein